MPQFWMLLCHAIPRKNHDNGIKEFLKSNSSGSRIFLIRSRRPVFGAARNFSANPIDSY